MSSNPEEDKVLALADSNETFQRLQDKLDVIAAKANNPRLLGLRPVYLGKIVPLANARRLVSTAQARKWILANKRQARLAPYFMPGAPEWHVDHIVPRSWGGVDHPRNYVMMPGSVNMSFRDFLPAEKIAYIGSMAARSAKLFCKYLRLGAESRIEELPEVAITGALGGRTELSTIEDMQRFYGTVNLAHVEHPFFACMSPGSMHRDWVSFRNCSLNIKTLEYRTWDDFKAIGEQAPFTDHRYDFEIDFAKLAEADNHGDEWLTPSWAEILKLQFSPEMCYVFEVLLGRLLYPVGSIDNWQVMPFLLGDGGRGKGTVLDIIKNFKPRGKVGLLSINTKDKLGLRSLYQKELIMCLDMPRNFAGVLDQATMQSMISGENVPAPCERKAVATDPCFSSPLIMAGSIILNYNAAEQEQWKRRLAVFCWENAPARVNSGLKKLIIQNELPYILLRCIARYRTTVNNKPDADFWQDVAPPALKHNQRYTENHMNLLARFLHEGSREHKVVLDKGRLTLWADFVSAYEEYLKELKQPTLGEADNIPHSALRQNDFEVFPPRAGLGAGRGAHKKDGRVNYCVYCPRRKSELGHDCDPTGVCRESLCRYVNCKNKGHRDAGRLKAYGIVNMRIVPKADFDQWLIGTTEADSELGPSESHSESLNESLSVKEWQERVLTLAATQDNTEDVRRAIEKMLETNGKAERKAGRKAGRKAERRRACQIAGVKNWRSLKKIYKEAQKRKREERQSQGSSSKKSRLSAEAAQERAEKYPLDKK